MTRISYDLSDYDNGDGTGSEGSIYQPAINHFMASVPANATDEQLAKVIGKYERMVEGRTTQTVEIAGARVKLSQATLRALVEALRARQSAGA